MRAIENQPLNGTGNHQKIKNGGHVFNAWVILA